MEKTYSKLRGLALFLAWIANVFIAYGAAHSVVPDNTKCLPLAYVFYWLLEGIDEIKLKRR